MIYVILLSLCFSLWMVIKLKGLENHDQVLYNFCQLRREMMSYLRIKSDRIPRKDYVAIRELLDIVNSTIADYNNYKVVIFNFNNFMKEIDRIYKSTKKANKARDISNDKVEKFYKDYKHAMFVAFWTYTPLLKHKLVVGVFVNLIGLVASNYFERHKTILKWVSSETDSVKLQMR